MLANTATEIGLEPSVNLEIIPLLGDCCSGLGRFRDVYCEPEFLALDPKNYVENSVCNWDRVLGFLSFPSCFPMTPSEDKKHKSTAGPRFPVWQKT